MKKLILLLSLNSLLIACSPDAKDANFPDDKQYFGPKGKDTIVHFTGTAKRIPWNYEGWISTHEFMQSLVNLFEFDPYSEVPYILLDKYYSNPNTTTHVTIDNGTYVEAALGIYGADIFNALNVGNKETFQKIRRAIREWEIIGTNANDPVDILNDFIYNLKFLPTQLAAYGVKPSVVSTVSSSLDSYLDILNESKEKLQKLKRDDSRGNLRHNVWLVVEVLEGFINSGLLSEEAYNEIKKQFEFPIFVISGLYDVSAAGVLRVLIEVIQFQRQQFLTSLNKTQVSELSDEEKEDFVNLFPEEMQALVEAIGFDDTEDLEWYKRGQAELFSPIRSYILKEIIENLKEKDLNAILHTIETTVNEAFIQQFAKVLNQKLYQLPTIVGEVVYAKFSGTEKAFYSNFYEEIKSVASNLIREELLQGEESFPGMESKYVYWPIEKTPTTYQSFFTTGAKEIGSSIQANLLFFDNVDKAPNYLVEKNFKPYVFALLNRLLAIFGYRDLYGTLYDSLHQKFSITESAKLDIFTYESEPGVFALPDNLILSEGYKASSQFDQSLVQTVSGRAAMLRASAMMLDFFADYHHSMFDEVFSSFKFQDFSVFPKEPLYDLALGSVSIILQNITKGEIVFFDRNGKKMENVNTNDIFEASKGAGGLALVSRYGTDFAKNVQGSDMSEFIIALGEVLKSASDLPRARTGMLAKLTCGRRRDLENIMNLLPSVRKLQYGAATFLHNKMLTEDGWLAATYYIEDERLGKKQKDLINQLKFIQAMLSVYEQWGADMFLWAAVDAYYVLNADMLTAENVYNITSSFPLYEVTEIWKTLVNLDQSLKRTANKDWWSDDSERQLRRLISYYRSHWQELTDVQ